MVSCAALVAGCGRLGFGEAPDGASDSYATVVLADLPLAYWRLDETAGTIAVDATGNGHSGLYSGAVTLGVPGALAGDPSTAVDFDGTNGMITLASGFDFVGTAAFSLEAWVRPAVVDNSWRHVFTSEHRVMPRQGYALLYHDPEGVKLERTVDDVEMADFVPQPLPGAFVHLVATYDSAVLRLYVNGLLVTQTQDSRAMPSIVENALIGSAGVTEASFAGRIDEVAVYGAALSSERIAAHFAAGSGT